MVLSVVTPNIVLSRGGLGAAPNNKRDKISVVSCNELESPHLGFDLSLLCFEL